VPLYDNVGVPVIPDLTRGVGPLGGIEAALHYFREKADAVLFLPCDMPAITASEVRRLCGAFVEGDGAVVVAETANEVWHPVCCVVPTRMEDRISRAVHSGHLGMKRLWKELGCTLVVFENTERFVNINSPEEYAAVFRDSGAGTSPEARKRQIEYAGPTQKGGAMAATINVPETILDDFNAFIKKENIVIEVVTDVSSEVRIETSEERRECSISTLYPGGWIKCEVARAMAEKLSVRYDNIGRILDFLDIKIQDCALGCF
jgi:molybdopterin-guanine dinucleotide biosynthesis protein A